MPSYCSRHPCCATLHTHERLRAHLGAPRVEAHAPQRLLHIRRPQQPRHRVALLQQQEEAAQADGGGGGGGTAVCRLLLLLLLVAVVLLRLLPLLALRLLRLARLERRSGRRERLQARPPRRQQGLHAGRPQRGRGVVEAAAAARDRRRDVALDEQAPRRRAVGDARERHRRQLPEHGLKLLRREAGPALLLLLLILLR